MEILGYSERGLLNSLFFTLAQRVDGSDLIGRLLTLAKWPNRAEQVQTAPCKTILVEQSFSDFGDADVVLLCEAGNVGQVIFLEAKCGDFNLARRWKIFYDGCKNGVKYEGMTSSLFCQLYFKQRLARAVVDSGERWKEALQSGISFSPPLNEVRRGTQRKIGENAVVLQAVNRIRAGCQNALFLAVLPVDANEAETFWPQLKQLPVEDWDTQNWGYLSVSEIDRFCRANQLETVIATLEFNGKQLFRSGSCEGQL